MHTRTRPHILSNNFIFELLDDFYCHVDWEKYSAFNNFASNVDYARKYRCKSLQSAIRCSLTGNLGSHIVLIIQNPQDEILSEYFSLSSPTDVQVRYYSLHTNRDWNRESKVISLQSSRSRLSKHLIYYKCKINCIYLL